MVGKPEKKWILFKRVLHSRFFCLFQFSVPEMDDLRKVVADLKELGDKVRKMLNLVSLYNNQSLSIN